MTRLAPALLLVTALPATSGEGSFADWVHGEAIRENLTVSRVGTLSTADGQRLPFARVESPPRSAVVVEVEGARWVLGPYEEGTEVMEPARDGLCVRVPSTIGSAHDLFLAFRGGVPLVV